MSKLRKYVNDKIARREKKRNARAVSSPYLKTIGGKSVWVADVLVYEDKELLMGVAISESNRAVRDAVSDGSPVEITRSPVGFWYISGRSSIDPGVVISKTYSIADEGLAFSEGWTPDGAGGWITGNENEMDPGSETTETHGYTFEVIPYGELIYGTTPYGATRYTRT